MNKVEDEGTPANVSASKMWRQSLPAAKDGPLEKAEKEELKTKFRNKVIETFRD